MISIFHSNHFSNVTSLKNSILDYINNRSRIYKLRDLDQLSNDYFSPAVSSFEEILTANPDKLIEIKCIFDRYSDRIKSRIKASFNVIQLYECIGFKNYSCSVDLDIKVCPLCNENYTYSFKYDRNNQTLRRTFDWDHLYPKEEYPFLAVSFFNLVPSCKTCNFLKHNTNSAFFNPFVDADLDSIYQFTIKGVDNGFLTDKNKIEINITFLSKQLRTELTNNFSVLGIRNRYNCHKELVLHLINRKRIYKEMYQKKIINQFNINNDQFRRTIFGGDFEQKNYYRSPFSKLSRDIFETIK